MEGAKIGQEPQGGEDEQRRKGGERRGEKGKGGIERKEEIVHPCFHLFYCLNFECIAVNVQ